MSLGKVLVGSLMAVGMLSSSVIYAAGSAGFSASQQSGIEKIVHDYLLKNPQILVEMSKVLQEQEQKAMLDQAQTAINANAKKIFDASSPVYGNPKGNVTLVEFFDYQCIHCQESASVIKELVAKNKELRVVFKEFPIFGSGSEYAAKAALAAEKQNKFHEFHDALMASHRKLSEAVVLEVAKSVGLDINKLKADINSKPVQDEIKANMALAEAMRLMATPIFIVGKTPNGEFADGGKTFFVPGAVGEDALQNYIKQANG